MSEPIRLDVEVTTLAAGQVVGVPRNVRTAAGDRPVVELWFPQADPVPAFQLLPRVAAALAGPDHRGVLRAARRLGLRPTAGPVSHGRYDEVVRFEMHAELVDLLTAGWNASLDVLQIFPGAGCGSAASHDALVASLFDRSAMFAGCAHDGAAVQVVALDLSLADLWGRIAGAAESAGVVLDDVPEQSA